MSRALLIKIILQETNCTYRVAAKTANEIVNALCATLQTEKKLLLSNFGTFRVITTKARNRVNPGTLELIAVPAKNTVRFKASQALRKKSRRPSQALRDRFDNPASELRQGQEKVPL
jgi:nucleoid DNA-binding protein